MAVTQKGILLKFYVICTLAVLMMIAVVVRLVNIQFVDGEKYKNLSEQLTIKKDTIHANRGSVFSADGSLLATSMTRYEIRMDVGTVDGKIFEENVVALSKELAKMFGGTSQAWTKKLRKARNQNNRYLFIARHLGYNDYLKVREFPIFRLGTYKGGFIANQSTYRAHPLGKVAERTIGYDDYRGRPGIEGAYSAHLKGTNGLRLKQKISKGNWKPINDVNEVEPINGKDIVTTIDVNIQDIAHHSLLRQLELYDAEHGCVIVMETKTGEVKAISNLGRNKNGTYGERRNYAVYEIQEPGSAFKLMSLVAALELGAIDTGTVVDTQKGTYRMYGRSISDSRRGGYGEISVARSLEVSSNIAFARIIEENFGEDPDEFIEQLYRMNLNEMIGIPIKGEGKPVIPDSEHSLWSKNALPSIAYGYNLMLTPLQTLTFYNAIANDGVMVKPRFVKEIRSWDDNVSVFDKEIINPKICSQETIDKVQEVLKNVVKRGTGESLYSEDFSMAGKTGTARKDYANYNEWYKNKKYISSFTGYFPAENPEYSCMVVIHEPSPKVGYYGADVSGPVFKDIAQKIYTSNHIINDVDNNIPDFDLVHKNYTSYFNVANEELNSIPNVKGMAGMDAISLLENLGVDVQFVGNGVVKKQSIKPGTKITAGMLIKLS